MKDELGDRMKMYEGIECSRIFMPGLPVVARIDGRGFSKFTKGMTRPFDMKMIRAMVETTKHLVRETNAVVGYTQSDEITLIWKPDQDIWFGGRISKMTSHLAAQATIYFYRCIQEFLDPVYAERSPTFDARVWTVPSLEEAVNVLVWREWDATKNSITMAASTMYTHKELQNKNSSEKQEMMYQKGVNWFHYPDAFKRGTYVARVTKSTPFTKEEIALLPEKHNARMNPELQVVRRSVEVLDLPPITKIKNRVGFFFGEEPLYT